MSELPASVRIALWTSYSWSLGADAHAVLRRALPDVDLVLGLEEQLGLWRELGEQVVYAALPQPGASGMLPRCDPEGHGAATAAGEALFVAGLGGITVPRMVAFGDDGAPAGRGVAIRWESFDAEPVPVHVLAGVDVTGADRRLRTELHAAIDALGDGGWMDAWQRQRPGQPEREWSLPPDLPERVRGVLIRAGSVLGITEAGLDHAHGSTTADLHRRRSEPLRSLRATAIAALEAAACVGAGYFADQSRSTRS